MLFTESKIKIIMLFTESKNKHFLNTVHKKVEKLTIILFSTHTLDLLLTPTRFAR